MIYYELCSKESEDFELEDLILDKLFSIILK